MEQKLNGTVRIARSIIAIAAIVHMIFSYIHTDALLVMENQICGFIMFLFVLFGLVALFESTQIHVGQKKSLVLTAITCFVTDVFGGMLVYLYQDALKNQASVVPDVVNKANLFSLALMAAFAIAGVLIVINVAKKGR